MGSVYCGQCGIPLDDLPDLAPHKHAPCPKCGCKKRTFDEHIIENSLTFRSHLSAVQSRENKAIGFSESEREGRAASASLNEDGRFAYALTGTSPQGEEDTLAACQILVDKLNSLGANWDRPTKEEIGDDGQAVDRDDPKKILRIQVVRATIDQNLWIRLSRAGKIKEVSNKEALSEEMKAAIESKANERAIPRVIRPGLVLALDATRLPGYGFDDVVAEFRARYGTWAETLGFEAIWVVGPTISLTRRLDVVP